MKFQLLSKNIFSVTDFENLFRGLGQAGTLGGVEVVMSMEEIPQIGPIGQMGNGIINMNVGPQGMPAPLEAGGNAPQPIFGADS